jgi:hypothetical protein
MAVLSQTIQPVQSEEVAEKLKSSWQFAATSKASSIKVVLQ